MENLELYNTVINNPIYLAIAVILALLLIYSALKRFIKMIILALLFITIYLGYLYFTGDPNIVKDIDSAVDSVNESIENSKGYIEEFKDNFDDE